MLRRSLLIYGDGAFDVVFMSHLLHHVDSPEAVIGECYRVLNTYGVLIVRYGAISGSFAMKFTPWRVADE